MPLNVNIIPLLTPFKITGFYFKPKQLLISRDHARDSDQATGTALHYSFENVVLKTPPSNHIPVKSFGKLIPKDITSMKHIEI